MSDWKDAAATASETPAGSGTRREDARSLLGEFVDAAGAAVVALLDEQKERAAARVATVGEAMRRAGQSLDTPETPTLARYTLDAAVRIDVLSASIRERSWEHLASDTAALARRRPTLFIAGAAALGFLIGRLISPPSRQIPAARSVEPAQPMAVPPVTASSVSERAAAIRPVADGAPDAP